MGAIGPEPARSDPNLSPFSGHLTDQGRYQKKAWELAVISIPSLPSIIGWKAAYWSRIVSPLFRQFWVRPPVGFCSPQSPLSFPTIHWTGNCPFPAGQPLESSWLWELDQPPSPRVDRHRRHHRTQRGWNSQARASRPPLVDFGSPLTSKAISIISYPRAIL